MLLFDWEGIICHKFVPIGQMAKRKNYEMSERVSEEKKN
jgi:hypothetical protein